MQTTFDRIFSRILAQSRLSALWSKSAFLANFVANFSKKLLLLRSSLKSTLQSKSFYVKLLVTASYMYTFLTLFSIKSAIYSYNTYIPIYNAMRQKLRKKFVKSISRKKFVKLILLLTIVSSTFLKKHTTYYFSIFSPLWIYKRSSSK